MARHRVVHLGYEEIDLSGVMEWYHSATPPFANEGAKRKEFPDAFALASLDAFNAKNNHQVAVITNDKGVLEACKRRAYVARFYSLQEYVNADRIRTSQFIAISSALGDYSAVKEAICRNFKTLTFVIQQSVQGEVEAVDVKTVELYELNLNDIEKPFFTAFFRRPRRLLRLCKVP